MPELPEVETSRRGIAPHIEGAVLKRCDIRQRQLRWPVPEEIEHALGERLERVSRRAKWLLLEFASGSILVHLGMSGNLRVLSHDYAVKKHDHIDLVFDNGLLLRLNDTRRFGAVLWQLAGGVHELLATLGPEPLSDDFDGERLYQLSRGRKVAVKQFIMDNKVVVGVGNIYANEALFAAGIHPKRAAGQVSAERMQRLAKEIKSVLARAIEQGGTTLRDFVGSDGKPGYFAQVLSVYGRAGQPCPECGAPIRSVTLGQRNTFFCASCQR